MRWSIQFTHDPRGHAGDQCAPRNVSRNYCAGRNDTARSYGYAIDDRCMAANHTLLAISTPLLESC